METTHRTDRTAYLSAKDAFEKATSRGQNVADARAWAAFQMTQSGITERVAVKLAATL